MEYQLTDLRQQLAEEKALTAQLREQLAQSQAQCEEFKQEAEERTHDLNQINGFYTNNDDEESFKNLLNEVVERHQVLAENLQNANYSSVPITNYEKSLNFTNSDINSYADTVEK